MNQRITNAVTGLVVVLFTVNSWQLFLSADEAQENLGKAGFDSLGDPLPEGALVRLGTKRFHHPSTVIELALSPDEKTVVTIGSDELITWNAATGKMQWRANVRERGVNLPGAAYGVRPLAFASDSSRFYSPGRHDEIIVWDIASGKSEVLSVTRSAPLNELIRVPNNGLGSPKAIDVTNDGRKFALGSAQGVIVCDDQGKTLYEIANASNSCNQC